ncbi:Uncharacterised protein [Mycolicibacterium vanbaalenii]|uniref:Uncharacterized protein n=1 Tax=Mycolicibacterium vanbaalenii TaxID=110539 RepID=A0A5S9RC52_MYCVN|nr:hypothetical protein [Mycolicibacterium vanbaalenii]CAA0138251.1 Uncharacterised protein [Mycolicibacterium vanbaalenii]
MSQQPLSAADAALRERITELSVHIPCGGIRGPIRRATSVSPMLWQSCRHEDTPAKWVGEWADVSRDCDLCVICFRATAGGRSRWAWLACENCRSVNTAVESAWGFRPFALGRHSLMNGIGVRGGTPPEIRERQIAKLVEFTRGDGRLRAWRDQEYCRLASRFDPEADIPLQQWQQEWPPSRVASRDAFARLIGPDFPLARP